MENKYSLFNIKLIRTSIICLLYFSSQAQTYNAYARVNSINAGRTILTLSGGENHVAHNFAVGEPVIVMQMQADVIGANTSNANTFGNLSAIGTAGLYEVRYISAVAFTGAVPNSITLTSPLANTFITTANSNLQVISFQVLGNNYTTTGNVSGLAWNGSIGGVIAMNITNTLTINHNINADGIGFRGGAVNTTGYESSCEPTLYRANDPQSASKGEGIYLNTTPGYTTQKGHLLNGGGGGVDDNGGGGGGGNYTAGGDGGPGWTCTAATSCGGLGGISLSGVISGSRIFMGGGGGGGQQNNNVSTAGSNGGGIIFIKAVNITSTCGTGSKTISANGNTTPNGGNDGQGGGGAAGSMVINVSTYSVSAGCPLNFNANGGGGGSVGNAGAHGAGGGGGQGVVAYSSTSPTTNVTTSVNNGLGGTNSSSGAGGSASGGSGVSSGGVLPSVIAPLPIELTDFTATCVPSGVQLYWATATELNNDYFLIERSHNGAAWEQVAKVKGLMNSVITTKYVIVDNGSNDKLVYYRMTQVDFGGASTIFKIIDVNCGENSIKDKMTLFPNPASSEISAVFNVTNNSSNNKISLVNVTGQVIFENTVDLVKGVNSFAFPIDVQPGYYTVLLTSNEIVIPAQKLMIVKP